MVGGPQEPLGGFDDGTRDHQLLARALGGLEGRLELLVSGEQAIARLAGLC
jgi:hypothetical protein